MAEINRLNIALIGAGSMGRTHAFSIQSLPYFYKNLPFQAVLHTVCTKNEESATAAKNDFQALYSETDFNKIINNPEIDVVDICTPNLYHFEAIAACLSADKNILCEKPLVTNRDEMVKLSELVHLKNKTYGTVFNNRQYPATIRAAQLIQEGRLGRILTFRSAYLHSSAADPKKAAGWKQNKEICGGGVLFDLGSHAIDLLHFLLGSDDCNIKQVMGKSQIAFPQRKGANGELWQTNADEAFYITAILNNGATGTIEASKIAIGANDDFSIELYGTLGSIKFSLMNPNYLYFYDGTKQNAPMVGNGGYTQIECVGRYEAPSVFPESKHRLVGFVGMFTICINI